MKRLARFRLLLFLLLLAVLYGFIMLRVDALVHTKPAPSTDATQVIATKLHIDQATINRIKQLQDNSVSVQTLFDQARKNPFQE